MVDLVVRRGGVEAVVRVECRQDGLLDQTVSVRNPLNNRLLVARVTGPGQVATGR
jgi:flagella basal body P-ring formation protein FlgA